ncbi:Histidine triad (HIT) protein [Mycobacteroides abscessus subsp. abscessus]|uniref:Histidine triad (HIT) protein n=1 Tax=Mycobacteroides abscessus subsp. abscessus TaxID=1185650 RepID=A0AB38D0T7_9MYCO|nr:Histidine triad (HIT) protein [Mycobacteroides abscessus subsp. abscessus]SKU88354.1 Histidine triad (HIT) protein [Mycobacteroides abscessus subsp. bolletii]SIA10075.1 Histidine triad (HIT) protein [Mycobacteroides abscessus subsp. abscessus]SIB12741.1 Histidine triad (HIT) protein [Mycobacteroides abscessus subsp. abscessus]SIB15822.1 Histidine triad (HIT) protein [Mycobacteroides abscessus subsp. abscessus]
MRDCPFCPRNWPNLNHAVEPGHYGGGAIIHPLDPVTEGHVLVISGSHDQDVSANPYGAQHLMGVAARYVRDTGIQANIITSIGPDATQTVFHTHLHVVPRRLNDDLPLPWTPQQMERERWRRALEELRL